MTSFLYQNRTTSYLLHNLRNPNPIIVLLHTKPLLPPPHPVKSSNPSSPVSSNTTFFSALFSRRNLDSLNPRILQSHSISRAPDHNPPTLSGNSQPDLRHREITGPTVERDFSSLANETREVIDSLRRSIYDLSSALAVLGIAHLGLGAWISYTQPSNDVSVQGAASFAFPFFLAFLLRRTLKPLSFLQKMEEQGRLQIFTLSLQVSKNLRLLFVRANAACIFCIVGISAGSVVSLLMR
ncbi:hypothetical protein KSP40_PGU018836 [Platanthera guangdongensis]|uniref:Uncharacterized protein n=1 Tax=Platanthera guangdongensis TaxID=2320717 RepID=A0ABR2M077_9ASPA